MGSIWLCLCRHATMILCTLDIVRGGFGRFGDSGGSEVKQTPWCNCALYRWESPTLHNMTSYLITWWLRTVTISVGRGWWVYPSDTLQWPPIFDFLSFSLHRRSSDIHHTSVAFPDHRAITTNYTHHTIGPVLCWRPPIWSMDHVVIFSFLSLFPFTRRILSWPDQSQVIAQCGQDLTTRFAAHEPCAHFTYCSYLRLLYLLQKTRKFSPELRLKFVSFHCFASLRLTPSLYLALLTHFALSHHTEPSSRTTLHSLILHQETISLLLNRTPQNHIGHTLRSPSPLIFVAS